MGNKHKNSLQNFPGFYPSPAVDYWQYPKILDNWWHVLTGSEQKCLDYILRHTWGFKKIADRISLSQFEKGVRNLDCGVGLARHTIIKANRGLERKGFIKSFKNKNGVTYQLAVQDLPKDSAKTAPEDSAYSAYTIKNKPINEKTINNTKVLLPETFYGNDDINFLIDYFKEKFGLPLLDGSIKQNRQYCWLLIKKFGNAEKVKLLIEVGSSNRFWKTKLTSFQTLYYNGVRIVSEKRSGGGVVRVKYDD